MLAQGYRPGESHTGWRGNGSKAPRFTVALNAQDPVAVRISCAASKSRCK